MKRSLASFVALLLLAPLPACDSLDDDGTYADYVAFELTSTQTVTITQTSDALDAFLSLYSATGVYVVAANSHDVETGAYRLTIVAE